MTNPLIADIIAALETAFPPRYQEDFDNTGLQVGLPSKECSGVLICVDPTEEIVAEAVERGCNLIISHHPLLFNPIKSISDSNRVDSTVYSAIRNDVAIYSCHTSVDNTPVSGVSWAIGRKLGLCEMRSLECRGAEGIGSGVAGNLACALEPMQLVDLVKKTLSSPVVRCSQIPNGAKISRVALCGGAGSFLIPQAIEAGAQVFITSDTKHNLFLDYVGRIWIIDVGHYESEECTREIFRSTLVCAFADFPAIFISAVEQNPIKYC